MKFMKRWLLSSILLTVGTASAWGLTPVTVQDFEKDSSLPKIWVVGIPNENASVQLSADHPHDGKRCLKLHYHFTGAGQYLAIPIPVKIQAPVHKLHFWLYGDKSGTGYGLYLTDARGETHKYRDAAKMKIDFADWKEITVDLDAPHETWGGDKNGKLDYPITGLSLEISTPGKAVESDLYFDGISVDSEKSAEETLGCQVSVVSPEYCADVQGDTPVVLAAPGFKSVTVKCWKQGGAFGSDSTVATVALDAKGNGSFVFPANAYPHGPVTVRISGDNGAVKDNCYLQLYNKGGVSWNEGLPGDPPAAKGMKLVFTDDFKGPLSISSTDPKATYYDHKVPNGSQDFSTLPFTGHASPKTPFSQVDSYLRIRASEKARSAGLISWLKNDGSIVEKVTVPCYFECRFIAPNARGTWPAFWLMTGLPDNFQGDKKWVDELDVIEGYGGEGPGAPNAGDLYQIASHFWNQGAAGKAQKGVFGQFSMRKAGIPSTWYEAFHTYGCKLTETDTIYYCDNIEIARHPTGAVSKQAWFYFMIDLATGGGWPVDLSRYNGVADMYVDFVRVYGGKK
jgi:hypothetical protein